MKEHLNNPEEEMFAAYGEDLGEAPQGESVEAEQQSAGEVLEDSPISDADRYAEQVLAGHSPEERAAVESIVSSIENVYAKVSSDDVLTREKATEALLGTAFAAAPTTAMGHEQEPLWKKVLTGASRGAHGAVKALALTATLAAPAAAQDYKHPSPEITKKVDYIFGSSIMERFGDRRGHYKKAYTNLEVRKKFLIQQLHDLTDARPRNTAEETHILRVEADRDAKLAALRVERTLETMSFESLHSNNPVDKAQYEANIASIAAREARAIEECEAQLLAEHRKAVPVKEVEDLRREIIRIEKSEDEIVQRFLATRNNSYSYGSSWGFGGGRNWTQWDGYK
ncbi:MAG TPA: hypothetical protein VJ579_02035 [Candidatus Paceibacterota bacterium]|nr:hypothetical protein [Candidatus Paceibacterota bacterium]